MTDVLIVGAGAAGLTAARDLTRAGLRVTLLEARNRVGGRMNSIREPGLPVAVELGAEFIHGLPPDTLRIVGEAGLSTREMPDRRWCASAEGRLDPAGESEDVQAIMDDLSRYRGPDLPFSDFLRKHTAPEDAKIRATEYVEGFNAADAARISVRSLADEERESEKVDGDRLLCLNEGYSALAAFLRAELPDVRLSSPVRRIEWTPGEVRAHTPRESFAASRLLVTIPVGVWQDGSVTFHPPLAPKAVAAAQLASGAVIRITFRFRSPFWGRVRPELREMSMLHTGDRDFPTWWTTQPAETPLLTAWAGGPRAERLSAHTTDELIAAALDSLARILAVERRMITDEFVAAWTHNWQTDPFARGAYSWIPAGAAAAPAELARPVENTLFFAGEATDTQGATGTVHGAIATGHRAAREILTALPRPQSR